MNQECFKQELLLAQVAHTASPNGHYYTSWVQRQLLASLQAVMCISCTSPSHKTSFRITRCIYHSTDTESFASKIRKLNNNDNIK